MTSWLQNNLRPAFKLIGTIMASIGAIIIISAIGKMAIWQTEPLSFYEEGCSYSKSYTPDIHARLDIATLPIAETGEVAPTKEEVLRCAEERQASSRRHERSRRLDSMIDGFALLIVGGVLGYMNRQKSN